MHTSIILIITHKFFNFNNTSIQKGTNLHVLGNTIAGIRALGDANICQKEFLAISDSLFSRLAEIVKKHGEGNGLLSRNCCALIAGFSYLPESHTGLSADDVVEVLFITTKSDDTVTRELVATTICNMTVSIEAAERLIGNGICEIIATLSGATSEGIQELCAKCICNLTCAINLHGDIISHKVLQTILMIALVRTVEDKTKLLCARAVMNLITDVSIDSLKEAGVIRVFACIAAVTNQNTQNQCAQGFLTFTTTSDRRDDICSRRPVLQALFLMVKSSSPTCRILVGMTVCNLLACPQSQKAAINAGALQVLKIISTMEYPQLREAAAKVIISLMKTKSIQGLLLKTAPVVPMLNFILHRSSSSSSNSNNNNNNSDNKAASGNANANANSNASSYVPVGDDFQQPSSKYIFACAVHAMSCVAQAPEFRDHVYDADGVAALVSTVLNGKITTTEDATEIIRTLCLLSYSTHRTDLLTEGHAVLALLVIYRTGLMTPNSAEMVCILIRNISTIQMNRSSLLKNGALLLMRGIYHPMVDRSIAMTRSIIISVLEFSQDKDAHIRMVEEGIMEMLFDAVFPSIGDRSRSIQIFEKYNHAGSSFSQFTHNDSFKAMATESPQNPISMSELDILRISKAIKNLSSSAEVHEAIVDGHFTEFIKSFLIGNVNEESMRECAEALCHISSSKQCRQKLVDMGSMKILLEISGKTDKSDIQHFCT